jgi:hypothetical protein
MRPKPKVDASGVRTYNQFRCHLTGVRLDTTAVVVFTGRGQLEVTGG